MSGPASGFGCHFHLRKHRAGVIEKGSTCRCQFDAASPTSQESRTHLVLKISNLPA
jgi:hypothetical protein